MQHLPGYLIAAAGALAIVFWIGLRMFQWRRRWGVEPVGGILVRTTNVDPELIDWKDLERAIDATRIALGDCLYTEARHVEWRVEIVPVGGVITPSVPGGVLPDGSRSGGSKRPERCLPVTKKHWVAVVTTDRPGGFMLHEVIRHIASEQLYGTADAGHTSGLLEQTEGRAKIALARLRES
jgi:hypothetical protein